jgi:hypothetical protein
MKELNKTTLQQFQPSSISRRSLTPYMEKCRKFLQPTEQLVNAIANMYKGTKAKELSPDWRQKLF